MAVILCAIFLASLVRADIEFDSVGFLEADSTKKFSGLRQHGVTLSFRVHSESGKFWIPTSLDLSAGWLELGSDAAAFLSFGPVHRMHLGKTDQSRWFTDFASAPTYVSNSNFQGNPLGGKLFFTSYLGVGAYLGKQNQASLMLRYQHISNAGLSNDNPGVDMVGLTVAYYFGGDNR